MMNNDARKFYEEQSKKWTDIQLVLKIRELKKLRCNEDVFALVLWNDIDKILEILQNECLDRLENKARTEGQI